MHRLHHVHTETDLDVHNVQRGFFFAHIGWLLIARHPRFLKTLANFEAKDLLDDSLVRFNLK